ncbi:MAG: hypothetical protein ACLQVY_13505 [Limisphaerales bacterium]
MYHRGLELYDIVAEHPKETPHAAELEEMMTSERFRICVSKRLLPSACRVAWLALALTALAQARAGSITVQPAGNQGFDVYANGALVAPIRLAANGAIVADSVTADSTGLTLSGLRCGDPLAVTFGSNDFVRFLLPAADDTNSRAEVQFQVTVQSFDSNRWLALFPGGPAPFHFLVCSMPTAQVWHQRGWLNATPYADAFPLLEDVHEGTPEISCLWNRNWSYLVPLGGCPIPMIGLWDPAAGLYVGYDFQGARAADQSERYIATAYCWTEGALTNFITLAYPYGGVRYGEQVFPQGGEVLASWFNLEIATNLPATEDPNERFQQRLFASYTNALPPVPAMDDLGWMPGQVHLTDFAGSIGLTLYGDGGETTFYPAGTMLTFGWRGETEMPVDAALVSGDLASINAARSQIDTLLTNYAQVFSVGGDTCLYWPKPLSGAWNTNWGGAPVTTLHNTEGWYAARVLVELYRYDRSRGQIDTNYLTAIDELFNWSKHFVWTRNEFPDVPSSPFAIGCTLSTAFLMDYYFTFKNDPQRGSNAALALHLADNIIWRYLQLWAMDSDHFDAALDGSFLLEPNSGRDWSCLACANEVAWTLDSLAQVYVNSGDPRMRYYLRGILQRWPALYQPNYRAAVADYGSADFTEGLGLFDGSGPGRGLRYPYGSCETMPVVEPVGNSTMRVVAGDQACIAFDRFDQSTDVADYRTGSNGWCSFRIVSSLSGPFDVSFSYPFVNISEFAVSLVRNGQTNYLTGSQVTRPAQSPSSLYLPQMRNGDVVTIGYVAASAPTLSFDTSLVYDETNVVPVTNGLFVTVPLAGDYLLPRNWTNTHSFAGIIPGLRWTCGVPYQQTLHAMTGVVSVKAPAASVMLAAYAPPESQPLGLEPSLTLDDGSTMALSGQPVPGWRAWPIIFDQTVLLDFAVLPNGRSVSKVNANGTLVMGLTAFTGDSNAWQAARTTLTNASATFVDEEKQQMATAALQAGFAQLPSGRIALLPLSTAGPGANFAAATGLSAKWDVLTEAQLVNSNVFNAARYPLAFYLGGENYLKTVVAPGDGKSAIIRYLAGGGTLVVLATGPFPFYYGYGPSDQPGPADPLLPALGLPIAINFEAAPSGIYMQRYTNQTILQSVPVDFAFPPGDQRLRAVASSLVSSLNRYEPLIKALAPGMNYGDAAAFIAFGTGPAAGGKILYVWDTLLSGPQGQWIMLDTLNWIVNTSLRPPQPSFASAQALGLAQAVFNFNAQSNVDYVLEERTSLSAGGWSKLQDLSSAPTNRLIWLTNSISGTTARFYRLKAGP